MTRLRRPGARWRLLVHRWADRYPGQRSGGYDLSHNITPSPAFARRHPDGEYERTHLFEDTEFDELVVGSWLHIEQMDHDTWWMNIGGVTVHVTADRDGRPTRVWVCGPDDYDTPTPGCQYELTWTDPDTYTKEN